MVEGRDDSRAVKQAVQATTIETHGYGISGETWEALRRAYEGPGLIVFTDPDHTGEEIRKRISARFPAARQAFLHQDQARAGTDIGIENARPAPIRKALAQAHCTYRQEEGLFSSEDLREHGLSGCPDAAVRRKKLAACLGIGYANAKTTLYRLNAFGITRQAFIEALAQIGSDIGTAEADGERDQPAPAEKGRRDR